MSSRHKSPADGDWTCSDSKCGNVNFARRSSCNRCGTEKLPSLESKSKQGIEIGKVAAEKSHGLFSAEDWACTKCGNVNWARRQTCNMCNAPRVGELEERTGYGGGFNERTGVEYIQREDSDDEYDAYGRKKKKSKDNEKTSLVKKPVEDESEDEDDDDEEGDLSKYDFFGDDDDDLTSNKDESETNGENSVKPPSVTKRAESSTSRSSRSRSRSYSSSSSSSRSESLSPPRRSEIRSRTNQGSKRRYARSSSRSRSSSRERKYSRK